MYEILLQAYGWEKGWAFIIRMGANVQTFTEGGSSAAKDVSQGQAAYGLCIDYYAFAEIERYGSERLGFMLPEGETVINPDAIGIIKNGPNPEAAKMFLEYVLTDGQKLWALKKGVPNGPVEKSLCRLPVDATLYSENKKNMSVSINPFIMESSLQYSDSKAGRRWSILGDLVASFVIIPHEDLKKCWKDMRQKGIKPEEFSRYFKIDLTEEQVFDLARKWDKKEFAAERIKYMNTWAANARKRYTSIYK
jgi:spermidine/putrescine-binding protein